MLYSILESLSAFSFIEWLGLLTGIIYVILSAQNRIICWLFGIISCTCIAYQDFFGGMKLYSDGILQLFYIVMGFVGIFQWRKRKINSDVNVNNESTMIQHLLIIGVAIVISLTYGWLMRKYTDAAFPLLDAFTTVFSVIATFLLVYRRLSAWVYFVVIDIIMTYLYFIRGGELYALLYLIFTLVAIFALWNWLQISKSRISSI